MKILIVLSLWAAFALGSSCVTETTQPVLDESAISALLLPGGVLPGRSGYHTYAQYYIARQYVADLPFRETPEQTVSERAEVLATLLDYIATHCNDGWTYVHYVRDDIHVFEGGNTGGIANGIPALIIRPSDGALFKAMRSFAYQKGDWPITFKESEKIRTSPPQSDSAAN